MRHHHSHASHGIILALAGMPPGQLFALRRVADAAGQSFEAVAFTVRPDRVVADILQCPVQVVSVERVAGLADQLVAVSPRASACRSGRSHFRRAHGSRGQGRCAPADGGFPASVRAAPGRRPTAQTWPRRRRAGAPAYPGLRTPIRPARVPGRPQARETAVPHLVTDLVRGLTPVARSTRAAAPEVRRRLLERRSRGLRLGSFFLRGRPRGFGFACSVAGACWSSAITSFLFVIAGPSLADHGPAR